MRRRRQEAGHLDAGADGSIAEPDAGPDASANADAASEEAGAVMQSVTIRFAAKVGTSDFACGQRYPSQGSSDVEVEPLDFRFYVQDLRLINAAGQDVPVQMDERAPWQTPDVALLDFENGEGRCHGNSETNTQITGKVPPGEYTGVAFRNGVPPALNHANPATVPAPLQAPGVSWNWLSGFRFLIAELGQSASDAGAGGIGLLHLGSTACEGDPEGGGSVTCNNPNRTDIRLTDFDPDTNKVVADIGALFANTDLSGAQLCHSATGNHHAPPPDAGQADSGNAHAGDAGQEADTDAGAPTGHGGNACAAMFSQVGLDLSSGDPLESQSAFRVE